MAHRIGEWSSLGTTSASDFRWQGWKKFNIPQVIVDVPKENIENICIKKIIAMDQFNPIHFMRFMSPNPRQCKVAQQLVHEQLSMPACIVVSATFTLPCWPCQQLSSLVVGSLHSIASTCFSRTAMQIDWQDAQADVILFVRSEAAGMVTGKQGGRPKCSRWPMVSACSWDLQALSWIRSGSSLEHNSNC